MWASLPFVTFGIATPFVFLPAAVRRRTADSVAAVAVYLPAWVAMFTLIDSDDALASSISTTLIMLLWLLGGAHAFAVRKRVYPPREDTPNDQAVQAALHRRELRERARRLAAEDPALAHELGIGRPDRRSGYDDGGLIDVNHAPPHVLARLPGMTPELVDRVDRTRREQGPFISLEELAVHADLPVHLMPRLAEYAVFLP